LCAKLLVPQYCIRNHSRLHHPFWWARVWHKRLFQVQQWGCFFAVSSLFSCLRLGKKRSLSKAQRAQIVILRQDGYTERAISERLVVSKTAVHQAVVKFKTCRSYSDCKSGRPRKPTRRDDILIKRCVVKSPTCSPKRIWAELGETGSRISRSRCLTDEFGLKSRKPARKPRLTPAIVEALALCEKIQRLDKPAMVQSFVFRRNNNSAVCLEEENCEESTRNSVLWKIHTANHETPPECDDLGAISTQWTAGLFFLDPGTTMNGKNIWNWWKRSWSYTWQRIVVKYLCTTGRHAIGQKSSRTWKCKLFKTNYIPARNQLGTPGWGEEFSETGPNF